MRDKQAHEIADLLAGSEVHRVYAVTLDTPRSLAADTLVKILESKGVNAQRVSDVKEGVDAFLKQATSDDFLLVTGSFMCVAQLDGKSFL